MKKFFLTLLLAGLVSCSSEDAGPETEHLEMSNAEHPVNLTVEAKANAS